MSATEQNSDTVTNSDWTDTK